MSRACRGSSAPGERPVELLNPMCAEQSVLRFSVLPGMLRAVANNQRRGVPDVHLYEIGAVWSAMAGRKHPRETHVVAGVLVGAWNRPGWNDRPPSLDFFDGKGVLESLAEALGIARLKLREAEHPWLQPGRCADVLVAGEVAGWLGEAHPRVTSAYDCAGPVTVFELALEPLVRAAREERGFSELPRYPGVKMDLAIVMDESVPAERVEQAIAPRAGRLLDEVRLFDVYRGEGIPDGKKSLAFSLVYREADRTLTDAEVEAAHERLVRKVTGAVGGSLRM